MPADRGTLAARRERVAGRRYTPRRLGPPLIHLGRIPKGYPGTERTVAYIKRLIRAGAKDFYVRQKAIDILFERRVAPKDYVGEIRTLFEWVQRNVRYTKDPFRLEVLHSAPRMLELRAGDCDDMSILLGAMLEAVGHPVRIVVTGPDPLRPGLFTHVYLEAFHRGRWIPLDATMPHPPGWAPHALVKAVIPIERRPDAMAQDMELQGTGLHGIDSVGQAPDWLRGLIRAVRREAVQPRDERVRSLWNLLRARQLLSADPWVRSLLLRIWSSGLTARQRPRTTRRLVQALRQAGILPRRRARSAGGQVATLRPFAPLALRPVAVRRFATARPVAVPMLPRTSYRAWGARR
jgi:Transglutaminase-like superfamily